MLVKINQHLYLNANQIISVEISEIRPGLDVKVIIKHLPNSPENKGQEVVSCENMAEVEALIARLEKAIP